MSNSKIEDTILTAIDILVDKKISSAEFDQTIKGVIERCENEALGKYLIRYQDSIIAAYSSDIDKKYQQGQNVYITVPKGDMKNDKIIIGTAEAGSVTFINNEGQDNNYLLNGYNLLSFEENKTWGLWSQYKYPDTIILYNYEDDTNRQVQVDIQGINRDIKSASHLFFSAKVQTELPLIQRYNGQYGIILQLLFKSNKDGVTEITRQYILDSNKMVGNPYDFTYPIEQKAYFEIDGQNFIRINKITLFVKDFIEKSDEEEKIKSDIFISDLKIMTAQQLSEQDKNGVVLNLIARKGYIFSNTALPTDERTIQAQVKIQSKTVNLEAQSLPFYWFVENGSITANSVGYVKYGGQGWYCLNDSYEIDEGVIKYNSGKPTFTIKNQDILTTETKYKCVVIYENVAFSKEFTINKMGAAYNLQIQSDQGFQFRYDSGSPILKCIIRDSNNEIIPDEEVAENFTFIWSSITKANVFYTEDSNTNTLQNIDVAEIVGFTTYKCSVFTSEELGQQFIGTASATLTNLLEGETKASLVINNGQQLFSYDESGASPMNRDVDNPIVYPELTFTIYDENNIQVSDEVVARLDKEWIVPAKNTMLVFPEKSGQKILSDDEQSYIFKNQNSLFYQIADKYSPYNINNTIQLRIDYNGTILTAQTDFIFLKQGDPGTNGTEYQVRIIPNTNSVFNGYPTIYACSTVQNTIIPNWDLNNGTSWFAIELWESGEKIFSGVNENSSGIEIEWSILKNDTDISFYDINSNSGVLSANYTNISNFINNNVIVPANIIKATITYENHKYYATLPLITVILPVAIRQYNSLPLVVQLKENGGFRFVKYDTDGTKPAYNDHTPFEILTQRKENDSYINFIYNNCKWKSISSFQNKINIETYKYENKKYILDTNVHQIYQIKQAHYFSTTAYRDCEINQIWMTPKNLCDGAAVTNALLNTFTDSSVNNQTVYVHIPVHFLLNRFFNAALNDWDGNSVNLGDQNGGMILAPQIGAGQKDNNNRFTGIVMGKRVTNTSSDIGLFGYNQGQQSIFLDAKTGRSTFGTENLGQIIIDPGSTQAIIKGGRYVDSSTNGTGMAINFSSGNDGPWIRYGSRKFMVDKDGVLSATGVDISGTLTAGQNSKIGPWSITSTSIWKGNSTYGQYGPGYMYFGDEGLSISNKFKVSNSGNLTVSGDADITGKITVTQGYIGGTSGWIITTNKIYSGTVDSGGNDGDVTLSTSNFQRTIGGTTRSYLRFAIGSNFGVSNSGVLYANSVDLTGTIKSSMTSFNDTTNNGYYLGSSGLALGKGVFKVTNTGALTATSATIGNSSQYFKFDGSKISWQGTNSSLSTTGTLIIGSTTGNHYLQYISSGTNAGLTIKGNIYANSGTFSGTITAGQNSKIGPWNITSTSIWKGNKNHGYWGTGNMYFGDNGLSISNAFTVDNQGNLTAISADISGTITSDNAKIGSDTQYFKFDGSKITWKATNTELDGSGNLTANNLSGSNVDLSGKLTSSDGSQKIVINVADIKSYTTNNKVIGHFDMVAVSNEESSTRYHTSLQARDNLLLYCGTNRKISFRTSSMQNNGDISNVKQIAYIDKNGLSVTGGANYSTAWLPVGSDANSLSYIKVKLSGGILYSRT